VFVYVALFGTSLFPNCATHTHTILTSVTLPSTNNAFPEDGVTAPKHVGAILK